jgi:broad specificity phosphatase PhoE
MAQERAQQVVLLRHGETEWSRAGRHTGRSDVQLTETGRRQAALAAPALRAWAFARVFCSPLRRARETAELVGLHDPVIRDELQEWDYGDVEGRTTQQVQAERPGWSLWVDGVTGGETVDQVGARADRMIAEVTGIDGDVCLVAHGHLLRILTARWLDLPPVDGRLFALDTATISVLGHERDSPCIWRWNDGSHLREG